MSETATKLTSFRWSFTFFGLDEVLTRPLYNEEKVRYLIFQLEKCPTTQKLHYQGYVEMLTKCRFTAVQKVLQIPKAHLEPSKGTADHNEKYCSKSATWVEGPWTFGSPMVNMRLSKCKNVDVIRERPQVCIFWGEPNSGKTFSAKKDYGSCFVYCPCPTGMWFGGYNRQDCILFDEFDKMEKNSIDWVTVFKLMDEGVCNMPVKGEDGIAACNKAVIFTANRPPDIWIPEALFSAFMSRVNIVRHFIVPHPLSTRPVVKYEEQQPDGSFI